MNEMLNGVRGRIWCGSDRGGGGRAMAGVVATGLWAAALLALAPAAARAEVPNLTPDQLRAQAEAIVVGPVVREYISERGSTTEHLTIIRAERVEKGQVELGTEISVRWWTERLVPLTTGSSGHRAHFVAPGRVVRAHVRGGEALLPNGLERARPLFVTAELLEPGAREGGAEALRRAGEEAFEHGAFEEAGLAFARALEESKSAEDRVRLADALAGQGRFHEAAETVRPLIAEGDADLRRAAAQRLLVFIWDAGDKRGFAEAGIEIARAQRGGEGEADAWRWALTTAQWLEHEEAERTAAEALKRMGEPEEEPLGRGERRKGR